MFSFNFLHIFFPKSIFIFQKWTKINVQKRLSKNNVGFSKNVEFYIINCQSGLKSFFEPSGKKKNRKGQKIQKIIYFK
jgi:hypothetical protein